MKKIPKFKITSEEEDAGVNAIAFTSKPAIKVKGMAFSSELSAIFFADELKYRITAPALIPMSVYRFDADENFEYEVEFTADEIDNLHQKFMKDLPTKGFFNLEHNSNELVPAYILEAWIVEDTHKDKAYTKFGIEVPVGTLMITSQITDKDYYNQLVKNDQIGYSVEGLFGLELEDIITNKTKQETMEKQEFKLADGTILMLSTDGSFEIKQAIVELEDTVVESDETLAEDCPCKGEPDCECDKPAEDMPMAEDAPADAPVEDAPAPAEETKAEAYTKEEIDDKFDELYRVIAELETKYEKDKGGEMPEDAGMFTEIPLAQRFAEAMKFIASNK